MRRSAFVAVALAAALALPYALRNPESVTPEAARAASGSSTMVLREGATPYRLERGKGPTVVLVHGALLNSLALWDPLVAALGEPRRRIVRYDLFGHGYSDRPAGAYDPARFDRQLKGVLDKLGEREPVHLVGFSLGGAIAAGFASRNPRRVATLALIAPAGLSINSSLSNEAGRLPLLGEYIMRVAGPQIVVGRYRDTPFAPRYVEHVVGTELHALDIVGTQRAWLSVLRDMPLAAMQPEFERIGAQGTPVLALFADRDSAIPPASAEALRALVPRARMILLENASHGLVIDRADDIARALSAHWALAEATQSVPVL